MCATVILVHRREAVFKAISHEILSGEVIAFVNLATAQDAEDARIAFKTAGVQHHFVPDVIDSLKAILGLLKRHTPHDPVNLIPFLDKVLGQVTSILTCYAGYKRSLHCSIFPFRYQFIVFAIVYCRFSTTPF